MTLRRFTGAAAVAVSVLLLAGCGLSVPTDPDGTLGRVTSATLRVGASPDGAMITAVDGTVTGPEAELVRGFADSVGADVEWTVSGEENLVGLIESGEIDLAVGGMTDQTLWTPRVGVTRGYTGIPGSDGSAQVMFVPLGENAFLSALEAYLDEEVGG